MRLTHPTAYDRNQTGHRPPIRVTASVPPARRRPACARRTDARGNLPLRHQKLEDSRS